ncbi:pre-rRNA processing [Cladophialophora chaetospira]|uniref:Pre-rRNA processing n=1 Tax=Cladophialophora chaetospira TaxID=386627 RepID=A0AA38WYS5_9EURO|nr:pre-rRNA processing [Cladophialophora chaetospira]
MEHEVNYGFEDEEQFWIVLEKTVSRECDTHDSIDDALRSYLQVIGNCVERFLPSDQFLGRCTFKLQNSTLFATHADYIRRQFIHCLIEDDDPNAVQVATSLLIADARSNEATYQLLNEEGAFSRLIDLISSPKRHGHEQTHRLLMELLYDMSRIQRIKLSDLAHVNDDFVKMLFEIIEEAQEDVNDPYHYPTIRVLVDILMRNLLDLPEEASSLRHTYLRVLYPLLENTQLQQQHYKRDEIRKLLLVLGGGHLTEQPDGSEVSHQWGHFDAVDDTTKRLVKRCRGVKWLDPETEPPVQAESPTSMEDDVASELSSPTSPSKSIPPALPAPRKLKKRNSTKGSVLTIGQYLTPQLEGARQSSLSMMEVAAQTAKPGAITPSRNPGLRQNMRAGTTDKEKEKPPPPQARRSGFMRMKAQRMQTDLEIAKAEITKDEPPTHSRPNEDSSPTKHHHHHPPIPFHHHHRHEKSLSESSDKGKEKEKNKPPPVPTHHRGLPFSKKPPPAPKARRRRGRDGSGDSTREPGKFSSNLPSLVPTSSQKIIEQSPFSPVEKTLSPSEPASASTIDGRVKLSTGEALEKAQAIALDEIEETLEHIELAENGVDDTGAKRDATMTSLQEHPPREAEEDQTRGENDGKQKPDISRAHSQEELDQPFHDAVSIQSLSPTPSYPAQSQTLSEYQTSEETVTPPRPILPSITTTLATGTQLPTIDKTLEQGEMSIPRMVLTPPAQQPSRGVPGPQFAIQRSPFLTDDDSEVEEETDQTEDEGESPHEKR